MYLNNIWQKQKLDLNQNIHKHDHLGDGEMRGQRNSDKYTQAQINLNSKNTRGRTLMFEEGMFFSKSILKFVFRQF